MVAFILGIMTYLHTVVDDEEHCYASGGDFMPIRVRSYAYSVEHNLPYESCNLNGGDPNAKILFRGSKCFPMFDTF